MGGSLAEGAAGEPGNEGADEGFEADSEGDESGLPASVETTRDQFDTASAPPSSAKPVEQAHPGDSGDGDPGDKNPHRQ
jgi:hypothetical protein